MQAQHGGHGEEGKDALGLAGRLSEQRALQGIVCFLSVCLSQSLFLSASQQQDGQLWRRTEMETDDRKREIESCSK